MAFAQSTYSERFAVGAQGMVANTEPYNSISRTNKEAIGFGQPAYENASNHEVIAGGTFTATGAGSADAANVGAGTITASPTITSPAQQGRYVITILTTGATADFSVRAPDGSALPGGNVGSAYSSGGLAFTISDPGTDPNSGDLFYVDVTYTENAEFIGLTIRDPSVPADATTPDQYPVDYTCSIMDFGVMWVTCAGSVARGNPVYWNPATGLYTTSTGIKIPNAEYYESATATLVRVKLRRVPG